MDIQVIEFEDPRYPELLRQIPDPPERLHCWGNVDCLQKLCIGVVGTRRATPYGLGQAELFGRELGRAGICVVSGLAYGIDIEAHKAAIGSPGNTIAVVAQPLHEIMPSRHRVWASKIIDSGGLIVSEWGKSRPCYKSGYLVRNRIVSGLSKAVLVVEAAERSGAANTANHCVEQNREVMVIPGRVTDEMSRGCLKLISKGAHVVCNMQDLMGILDLKWRHQMPGLNTRQKEILDMLKEQERSPAELAELFSGSLSELYQLLTELELLGVIRAGPLQRYCLRL